MNDSGRSLGEGRTTLDPIRCRCRIFAERYDREPEQEAVNGNQLWISAGCTAGPIHGGDFDQSSIAGPCSRMRHLQMQPE